MESSEWVGRVGAEWAKQADGLDLLVGPMGEAGIEALGALGGLHVLDLGCGAGATSLSMAMSGARVHGVDLSPDLIAKAKLRDVGDQVRFEVSDATTHRFEARFDRLYSRFGCMFFEDPLKAYQNLHQAMKPGGRAALVAWSEPAANQWVTLPTKVGRALNDGQTFEGPPAGAAGPFGWDQEAYFAPMLREAGWQDVRAELIERELVLSAGKSDDPMERAVEFCLRIGPMARRFREMPDEKRARAPEMLTQELAPYLKNGAVRVRGKSWLVKMHA